MTGSIHRGMASELQDRGSSAAHSIAVPPEIVRKWQEFVDLLAEIMHVPSASIMRVEPPHIKVFVSSTSKGNPCEPGALDTGPYCETVMKTGQPLLVPDARENEAWKLNPHVRQGMISYLGVPIAWPDGRLFGTICVRDNKRNEYSAAYLKLVLHFRDMLQADLKSFATLQGQLEQHEVKIRRLMDANIIGIIIWDLEGRILEANDAFLRTGGYNREDLISGRLNRTDLTPPEWRERDARTDTELKINGAVQPFEKEYFRKDGGRVPVLIGLAAFGEQRDQGVAFVLDLTERKRAEGALREREAKIRRLVDANIIGIFITGLEGLVLEANDAFLRLVGHDREDLISGRVRWTDLTPPEWREHDKRALRELYSNTVAQPYEKEFFRKDGSRVSVLIGGALFEKGRDEGVAFVLDLTERKRGEDALREREAQLAEARRELRQMIDTIPIPVASYSADARRDFVNAAWKKYTGLSDEAALGTEWSVVAHPDDVTTGEKMWRNALASGEPWHAEERVRRADGQYRWFAIDRVTARDENGKIIKWYGTAYDIEDRKRAEERLRVQHTVAQILTEATTIEEATPRILWAMGECLGWDVGALWRLDREAEALRCVELWHKATIEVPEFESVSREFTFLPGLGLPGRVWSSLQPEYVPDVVPDENFPRGPIAEREGLHAAFGFPILLGGEALGVIEFFSREIRQPDQELLNTLATIGSQIGQFIERKRAEEALRKVQMQLAHANRVDTMGQLTASIAHEVKQPIATARNNARAALNFLDKQPPDLGEVREALGCIVGDADRAGGIIDRIRDHIKKAPPRNDCFDLNRAIDEVIELAQSAIAETGVSVKTRLRERMYPIQGDRIQVQQVVLNLILNAIEAMGSIEAGVRELLISTEQSRTNDIIVAVHDTGPGIDPECLDRVFEAFYTTKSGGMGMGLSICQTIIDAHEGRLWAEANEPRGTVFQFTLPSPVKEFTNYPQSAPETGEPHEDRLVAASRRPASEGSK